MPGKRHTKLLVTITFLASLLAGCSPTQQQQEEPQPEQDEEQEKLPERDLIEEPPDF